ncbi:MAG: Hint domain-containing protein [Paracoccus denitrificans]|uniref:Hint domain-containing protein n=1 Tax=Paracoccus denitrificans TaxID=266 RepID=A0A533I4Y3_PARDE|nr:MAG: Hint domain-containing protein [Paracoccus denitrificans]
MANLYVVDSSEPGYTAGSTINVDGVDYRVVKPGSNLTVNPNDNVIVSSVRGSSIEFRASNQAQVEDEPLNITVEGGHPSNMTISFSDYLSSRKFSPTINVPEGANASMVNVSGSETGGVTVNVGDNARFGDFNGGFSGSGGDLIILGNGASAGVMDVTGGDDTVMTGENSSVESIVGGSGDDYIYIGDNTSVTGGNTGAEIGGDGGDDTINISLNHDGLVQGNLDGGSGDVAIIRYGDDEQQFLDGMNASDDFTYDPATDSWVITNGGGYADFDTMGIRGIDRVYGVTCFAAGTEIEAQGRMVLIEDIRVGDLVMTRDRGPQPVRWIGSHRLDQKQLAEHQKLKPIRISAGALGQGIPASDLIVSPQHRILVRSSIARRMFGADEILVAAKKLTSIDGISVAEDVTQVVYYHMLFDQHEIVIANGAEAESLYTGEEALKSLGPAARDEIFSIFPELRALDACESPAGVRPLAEGRRARKLAERHAAKGMALIN